MLEKDDWRLLGQDRFLKHSTLTMKHWRQYSSNWDHDHCEFCIKTFMNREDTGYCTLDEYHWICEECFEDFRDMFEWNVVDEDSYKAVRTPVVNTALTPTFFKPDGNAKVTVIVRSKSVSDVKVEVIDAKNELVATLYKDTNALAISDAVAVAESPIWEQMITSGTIISKDGASVMLGNHIGVLCKTLYWHGRNQEDTFVPPGNYGIAVTVGDEDPVILPLTVND